MNQNIYGSIGYTYLANKNNKVIVLADNHNKLESCNNNLSIGTWLNKKKKSSKVLLEEVPRDNNVNLSELWPDSPHTQELKNIYLSNSEIITGVDLRPHLIPFSLEIIDQIHSGNFIYQFTLKTYLIQINKFFCFKNPYVKSLLSIYNYESLKNTPLGLHYLEIKAKYKNILDFYDINISFNKLKKIDELQGDIANLLDNIMEWYICACLINNNNKNVIIHTGLSHSEKIIDLLVNKYNYNIIQGDGINKLEQLNYKKLNGCITLPLDIEKQFGGINK